jgi:hypothetical protein
MAIDRHGGLIGKKTYSSTGFWSLKAQHEEEQDRLWGLPPWTITWSPGLAGKFFNGTAWRTVIAAGNIGAIPLGASNESSNVTATTGMPADYRFGTNIWPFITYSTVGDNYGFIAIGYFFPPETGTYNFWTSSDDHSGMWIGPIASAASGRTAANAVVNNGLDILTGQGNTKRGGTVSLNGGQPYAVRVVHEEGGGGDNLTLSWAGPSISETTTLTQYFFSPAINGIPLGRFL